MADGSAEAFINGTFVDAVKDWRTTCCQEVSPLLHKGKNTLAFDYRNAGFGGGVFTELFVKGKDDSIVRINSAGNFLSSMELRQRDWNKTGVDTAG